MNFIFFALGIFAALIALTALATILRVALGQARWNSDFAPIAQAFYVAAAGSLAAWLFSLAFQ